MKKNIVFVLIAVGIFFFIFQKNTIERLMDVEYPIVATDESGEKEFTPDRGSVVEMSDLIEPGLINIIHLYRSSCAGCQIMDSNIAKLLAIRPDVAVTLIPSPGVIGYQARSLGKVLEIQFVPFIIIFDRNGDQLAINDGENSAGTDFIYDWLNAEVDRINKQKREEWLRNR